jgi:hypothetical protein
MLVGCAAADPADNRTPADPAEIRGAADPADIQAAAAPSPTAATAPITTVTRFTPLWRGAAARGIERPPARACAAGTDPVSRRLSGFAMTGSFLSQGTTLTGIRRHHLSRSMPRHWWVRDVATALDGAS